MVAEVVRMKAGRTTAQVIQDMGLQVVQAVEVQVANTAAEACLAAVVGMRSGQGSRQAPATACFAAFRAEVVLGTWTAEVARQDRAVAMEVRRRRQRQVLRQEAWYTNTADPASRRLRCRGFPWRMRVVFVCMWYPVAITKGVKKKQSEKIVILLEQDCRLGIAAGRAVNEQH